MIGTLRNSQFSIIIVGVTGSAFPAFSQEPTYKLDAGQHTVVSLAHLTDKFDCSPSKLTGRVVHRSFDAVGVVPTSITIESKTGARSYVNIDNIKINAASMVTQGWVVRGLQTIFREGKSVTIDVYLCGAAGRVIMLNSVATK